MKNIILSLTAIALFACAPKADKKGDPNIDIHLGPTGEDQVLDLSHLDEQTQSAGSVWQKTAPASAEAQLDLSENIYFIARHFQIPSLKTAVLADLRAFRQDHQSQTQSFESSPYVEAIVGSTEKEAQDQIRQAQAFLPSDAAKINAFLIRTENSYAWPAGPLRAAESVRMIEDYITWFLPQLSTLNVNPMVADTLKKEIPARADKTLQQLETELTKVSATKNSADMIQALQVMIKNMAYQIDAPTTKLLGQGAALANANLRMQDEQDVLTVIVQIFKLLEPNDRKALIGAESKDLYDYLSSASPSRLECLAERMCKRDGMAWAAKDAKIFPEIRKRGVGSLKAKIDSSMQAYISDQVNAEIYKAGRGLPQLIADQVSAGVGDELTELQGIQTDYGGYVKKMATKWSGARLASLNGRVRGLEQAQISTAPGESGSQLLGQGLLMKTKFLNDDAAALGPEERIEWSLEHLNKLLALGGYKKNETDSVRSIAQALEVNAGNFKMPLQDILDSKFSFAVPDQIILSSAYTSKVTASLALNVSVLGQARLLRGFSESMKFLKDWQTTSFDPILGNDTLSKAFSDAPSLVGDRKLFPKDTLFALSVGNAAVILKNLLKELSPVFVIGQESKIIWANDFNLSDANASAMAGVVNLMAGQRDLKVSATDLSEYIRALGDFAAAAEGIENTKSDLLLKADEKGHRSVDDLIAAQRQLKLLVVGLANFLSNRMVGADGWVHESFAIKSGKVESSNFKVMTQFKAIEALLRAYEVTQLQPYAWSAVDLYYKLNREMFNSQKGFYNGVDTLADGAEALKVLKKLHDYLPVSSQGQLSRVMNSWTTLVATRF